MTDGDGQLGPDDLTGDPENADVERATRLLARLHGDDEADGGTPAGGGQPGGAPTYGGGFLDDALTDFDREDAIEAGLFHRGYSVVVRTVKCGKVACVCAVDYAGTRARGRRSRLTPRPDAFKRMIYPESLRGLQHFSGFGRGRFTVCIE